MPAFRNGAVYLSVSLSGVVLGVVPSPSQPPESSELPLVDVVAKVDRSLVNVVAGPASASGFVFSETRWIVTNRHVVAEVGQGGSVKIRPVLPPQEGRSKLGPEIDATVRMLHPDLDLAVLEILPPIPSEIQAISMVASSLLPRGTEVLIHGFPATSVPTVSRGIVSGHHHDFSDDEPVYLLDAASGSGSSGGPVTDRSGNLVGVATTKGANCDPRRRLCLSTTLFVAFEVPRKDLSVSKLSAKHWRPLHGLVPRPLSWLAIAYSCSNGSQDPSASIPRLPVGSSWK